MNVLNIAPHTERNLIGALREKARAFQVQYPEIQWIEVLTTDLNGQQRGKLIQIDTLCESGADGLGLPVSALLLDVFGEEVEALEIGPKLGDPDAALKPDALTLAPVVWGERPSAQIIASTHAPSGVFETPIDPRVLLARSVEQAKDAGYFPVAALELEFYLFKPQKKASRPTPPRSNRYQAYDMNAHRALEAVMVDIIEAAQLAGAPAQSSVSEYGAGQFEINLRHCADPVAAADHLITLKRAVRGVARKHGYDATFMALPYAGNYAGSGMHLHLNFNNERGANLFSGGRSGRRPSGVMRAAIAGMLNTMADGMLLMAPHANSYRRYAPGSYAPQSASWGEDNRCVALRCPQIHGPSARIEHRTAGADANPYLILAHAIWGAIHGVREKLDPGPPHQGEAGLSDGAPLPRSWAEALEVWRRSEFIAQSFGETFQKVFAEIKQQEQARIFAHVPDIEYDAYLKIV